MSRPAGSRNDARLVEPGKLLRRYTRPKGECTAERYIYVGVYVTRRRKADEEKRRVYIRGVTELPPRLADSSTDFIPITSDKTIRLVLQLYAIDCKITSRASSFKASNKTVKMGFELITFY